MKVYKFLLILVVILFTAVSCAYDDSYLDAKLPKNMVYFASSSNYSRTVVVGEGLQFKVGAAMAGVLKNTADRTVNFKLGTMGFPLTDTTHIPLPTDYYNYSSLITTDGTVQAIIPKGDFIGYFTVILDSVKFLSNPLALSLGDVQKKFLSLPVQIVKTSLDSINKAKDSVTINVRYIARFDGFYLYKNTIQKELNGVNIGTSIVEDFQNESDNSVWRLLTKGPFTVQVTSAISEVITSGITFDLTVDNQGVISYQTILGQAAVQADGISSYDKKTRNFSLKYTFKKPANDTIYHVTSNLIFRNRMRDGINEPRAILVKP